MAVVATQHSIRDRLGLTCLALAAFCCVASAAADEQPYTAQGMTQVDARTLAGWRALRQFDCARCHGAQYQGSVGPSLIEAARTSTREQFLRLLLDGNPERGMPPYREVPGVAGNAEGIYGYLRGRADGNIGAGALQLLPKP